MRNKIKLNDNVDFLVDILKVVCKEIKEVEINFLELCKVNIFEIVFYYERFFLNRYIWLL